MLLGSGISIKVNAPEVLQIKIWIIVASVTSAILSFLMYYASQKSKRRSTYIKLNKNLIKYMMRNKFKYPLLIFAERNEVPIHVAQGFIDHIIKHFKGRLDINAEGFIVYKKEDRV